MSNKNNNTDMTEEEIDTEVNIINDESSDNESYKSSDGDESDGNLNDDDFIAVEEVEEEIIETEDLFVVKDEDRITRPFMTKYELTRIIGTRRKQLSLGAKPLIKVEGNLTLNQIVDEEIRRKMTPLQVRRPLPDSNKIEIWKIDELYFDHLSSFFSSLPT